MANHYEVPNWYVCKLFVGISERAFKHFSDTISEQTRI